jgi:hypothetical protein
LAGLLSLWPPLDKFFSPGADRLQLKSGVGISETNKKYGPRTGYQINLRSGLKAWNPPICLFDTLFSYQCPFKIDDTFRQTGVIAETTYYFVISRLIYNLKGFSSSTGVGACQTSNRMWIAMYTVSSKKNFKLQ